MCSASVSIQKKLNRMGNSVHKQPQDLNKPQPTEMIRLFDVEGQRLYLSRSERLKFLVAADKVEPLAQTFCQLLAFTGCRLSEALMLTSDRVDVHEANVIFETLKQRRRGVYRTVPIPKKLSQHLDNIHHLRTRQKNTSTHADRLWSWSRTTSWMKVKHVMEIAGISGKHATPKGLRHAFGVHAVAVVPATTVQKWMGHQKLETTQIYCNAVGPEERALARRLWSGSDYLD